jgi:hypothetical protein
MIGDEMVMIEPMLRMVTIASDECPSETMVNRAMSAALLSSSHWTMLANLPSISTTTNDQQIVRFEVELMTTNETTSSRDRLSLKKI